jgi:hypothetical protein
MPSAFPLNLVNSLKKSLSPIEGHKTREYDLFALVAIVTVYLSGPGPALANSAEEAGSTATSAASQDVGAVSGNVSASQPMSVKTEELLLKTSLAELRQSRLDEAITNLTRLKDAFPDNDDYLLLYRTALRKKNSSDGDSQQWYSYVRSLDKKEDEEKASLGDSSKDVMTVHASGRINELKRETWLVLTTGKYKSANEGRRVQRHAK